MKLKTGDIVYGTDFKREDITVNTRTKNSFSDILIMTLTAASITYFAWWLGFQDGANEGTKAAKEAIEKVYPVNATEKEI